MCQQLPRVHCTPLGSTAVVAFYWIFDLLVLAKPPFLADICVIPEIRVLSALRGPFIGERRAFSFASFTTVPACCDGIRGGLHGGLLEDLCGRRRPRRGIPNRQNVSEPANYLFPNMISSYPKAVRQRNAASSTFSFSANECIEKRICLMR